MTVAAAIESRTAGWPTWSKTSRIASVDFFDDLGQAETIWRSLENPKHFSTPYQRFDFLRPWQSLAGKHDDLRPFVVIAYDRERRPLLLLPLALSHAYGLRIACFMGGKHTTFNMALWDRDFATQATRSDLDALISAIREGSTTDVLAFNRQPLTWDEQPNPMALLPRHASVNDCPVMTIVPGSSPDARVSHSLRRRLKGKERKLTALPGYRYHLASTEAEIERLLEAFFRIKPQRMAEQKLPDVFAEPGVEDFVRRACMTPLASGGHVIDIHALECDSEVIAIFAGVANDQRFSMMFNTYTMSDNARYSPGLILMRNIVDYYAERGYRALDLGIGSDDYKRLFCKDDEPIFDSFIPLSPGGTLAAGAMSSINRAKHFVKHTPVLLQAAQRLRNVFR
jgi:CelD/BcsL family acetyltransferase involved in cellulose biosynthesis